LRRNFTRALRQNPTVVGADLGLPEVNFDNTSAGDSSLVRRIRQQRAELLNTSFGSSFDNTRRKLNHDYREMEREVPELGNSKAVLVDFAFGGDASQVDRESAGVQIVYSSSAREEVRQTNSETMRMLQFGDLLPKSLDEAIQLGDSATELIYRPGKLVAQKALVPVEDLYVHWGEYQNLRGYTYRAQGEQPQVLMPWQVAHLALDRKRGHRYGTSNWLSARKLWRAEQSAMDVLGILTLLRAAARKSVAYAVPDNLEADQIDEFVRDMARGGWSEEMFDQDGMMQRQIAALLELDDIVYPYRASADPPTFHDEPPANLTQVVESLKYYQERYFVATGVPAGLAGMERNVNARSTLEHQGLFFVRKVKSQQRQVASFTVQILVNGLIARNIVPQPGEFTVVMPRVSTFDEKVAATTDRIKAQTIKLLHTDGQLDLAWVLQFALHVDEEEAHRLADMAGGPGGTVQPDVEAMKEALASNPDFARWLSGARMWMDSAAPDAAATVPTLPQG